MAQKTIFEIVKEPQPLFPEMFALLARASVQTMLVITFAVILGIGNAANNFGSNYPIPLSDWLLSVIVVSGCGGYFGTLVSDVLFGVGGFVYNFRKRTPNSGGYKARLILDTHGIKKIATILVPASLGAFVVVAFIAWAIQVIVIAR